MHQEHALTDTEALTRAFELLTQTTARMEEAYRLLEGRVDALDRELAEKNRELALTSEYLGNLLESMSDGVIAVDTGHVITRFNRAAGSILGYSAEECTGRPFREVFGREFRAPRQPGHMRLRAKSGRHVPVSERDSAIADHSGKRLGAVKTFQDLSELIALREQVRQVDRLAAIGEMAATVAHEIRNPLGGIRGFAAFLAQDIEATDPRRRLVEKIQEGAKSLEMVVNELLEYTRPVELELRPASCSALLQAAAGFVEANGREVSIAAELAPDYRVLADSDKITRVFLNILMNAVESIESTGRVWVSARADDHYVDVTFTDTGCGMTPEQLQQMFSPFFTTKERGTGLGLAICQKIIEGHGGRLWAASEEGNGSAVTVRLPRAE